MSHMQIIGSLALIAGVASFLAASGAEFVSWPWFVIGVVSFMGAAYAIGYRRGQ